MEIDDKTLQEVENLAGLFMVPEKIAVIVQIPFSEFKLMLLDPSTAVSIAFKRGSLRRESELRKSVLDLADRGSSPAQTLAVKMLDEFKDSLSAHSID